MRFKSRGKLDTALGILHVSRLNWDKNGVFKKKGGGKEIMLLGKRLLVRERTPPHTSREQEGGDESVTMSLHKKTGQSRKNFGWEQIKWGGIS